MSNVASPHAEEVALLRAEIEGMSVVTVKAAGLPRLVRALDDLETPVGMVISIMRVLMDLGNLTPKKDATPVQHGSKFSVTINIPSMDGRPMRTIQGVVEEEQIEGTPSPVLDGIAHVSDNADLGIDA